MLYIHSMYLIYRCVAVRDISIGFLLPFFCMQAVSVSMSVKVEPEMWGAAVSTVDECTARHSERVSLT